MRGNVTGTRCWRHVGNIRDQTLSPNLSAFSFSDSLCNFSPNSRFSHACWCPPPNWYSQFERENSIREKYGSCYLEIVPLFLSPESAALLSSRSFHLHCSSSLFADTRVILLGPSGRYGILLFLFKNLTISVLIIYMIIIRVLVISSISIMIIIFIINIVLNINHH